MMAGSACPESVQPRHALKLSGPELSCQKLSRRRVMDNNFLERDPFSRFNTCFSTILQCDVQLYQYVSISVYEYITLAYFHSAYVLIRSQSA